MHTVPSMCCICASRLDHSCWDDESPGKNAWAWPFFCRQKRDILQKKAAEDRAAEERAAEERAAAESAAEERAEEAAAEAAAAAAAAAATARKWEEQHLGEHLEDDSGSRSKRRRTSG